jgi:hypothetical protein
VAAILIGIVAFKQDWDTQAREAENFLGGQSDVEAAQHLLRLKLTTSYRQSRLMCRY